jgi:CRISPR/Cas system-associated endonuclease Cas1
LSSYLHTYDKDRAALVFDLMEPLRPVADRVVLSFVRTEISSHLMAGAASTTTGNIVAHEINQDDNQFCKNGQSLRKVCRAGWDSASRDQAFAVLNTTIRTGSHTDCRVGFGSASCG